MTSDMLEGLTDFSEDSIEKILGNLLTDNNIELKTEINNPFALSVLKTIQKYLKEKKLQKSSGFIKIFIKYLLKYYVSYERKSRTEIVDAVKGMIENSRLGASDRLFGNLKEL